MLTQDAQRVEHCGDVRGVGAEGGLRPLERRQQLGLGLVVVSLAGQKVAEAGEGLDVQPVDVRAEALGQLGHDRGGPPVARLGLGGSGPGLRTVRPG